MCTPAAIRMSYPSRCLSQSISRTLNFRNKRNPRIITIPNSGIHLLKLTASILNKHL